MTLGLLYLNNVRVGETGVISVEETEPATTAIGGNEMKDVKQIGTHSNKQHTRIYYNILWVCTLFICIKFEFIKNVSNLFYDAELTMRTARREYRRNQAATHTHTSHTHTHSFTDTLDSANQSRSQRDKAYHINM